MTMTTCKRLELFEKTLFSFLECCNELDFISQIILVDDGSFMSDIVVIDELLQETKIPYLIIRKSNLMKGHQSSLNIIWDLIKTDFILHIEDDWEFKKQGNWISTAFNLMIEDPSIKQVLFRHNPDIMAVGQKVIKSNDSIEFVKYEYNGAGHLDPLDRIAWPGFNLNPSLIHFKDIQATGRFIAEKDFEYHYSRNFWRKGYKVAYFPENICEHIGMGQSSYVKNGTGK